MAMEKQFTIKDAHTRPITAIGYNPYRREILIGCDDGFVKTFEADTAKLTSTFHEHRGWVIQFLYWHKAKIVFSAANDSSIVVYSTTGTVSEHITLSHSVYCMEINGRKNHMTLGSLDCIKVYELDEIRREGRYMNRHCVHTAKEHTDLVKTIVCLEGRVYSGGYDQRLIFYDSSYTETMKPVVIVENAHNAGINTMVVNKDQENTWVATGSFDKTVKIWSPDGKAIFKFDTFIATITSLCFVPLNKTIWIAAGTNQAFMYDPKTGDNVSEFVGTFGQVEDEIFHLQFLKYCPEFASVIGTSNRRHLFVWKYNSGSCISSLKARSPLECLCYTKKEPILMFSGDAKGALIKWERLQSNHFMYSQERFDIPETKAKQAGLTDADANQERLKKADDRIKKRLNKEIVSEYAYHKPQVADKGVEALRHRPLGMLKCIFIEELDLLVGGCEDNNLYVWGFDEEAVNALDSMELPMEDKLLIKDYAILLNNDSDLFGSFAIKTEDTSVTNRVAGFVCRYILSEHQNYVSALTMIPPGKLYDRYYVLSGGWDSRIILWDLKEGTYTTTFRYRVLPEHLDHAELACDGIITDIAYLPSLNQFGYSSSDQMIYIRQFSLIGKEMVLLNTLQGHTLDVLAFAYNPKFDCWVSGGDDGTIRIWETTKLNDCRSIIHAQCPVQCLCIDSVNGAIIAGAQDVIRIYDASTSNLVQSYTGHTDQIKAIIHVPERNQYVSTGTDKTIRIWNGWKPVKIKHKTLKEKKDDMKRQADTNDPNSPTKELSSSVIKSGSSSAMSSHRDSST